MMQNTKENVRSVNKENTIKLPLEKWICGQLKVNQGARKAISSETARWLRSPDGQQARLKKSKQNREKIQKNQARRHTDCAYQTASRLDSKNPWKFSKSVRYRKTRQKFAVSGVAPLLGRVGATCKKLWYLQIYTSCCKFSGLRTEPVHPTICFGWRQRTAIVHLLLARNQGGLHWEIRGGLHSRKSTHSHLSYHLNTCMYSFSLIVRLNQFFLISVSAKFSSTHRNVNLTKI